MTLQAQQNKIENAATTYLKVNKIVKKSGWEFPKKDNFLVKSANQIEHGGFSISVENLEPKGDIDFTFQEYFLKDESLEIKNTSTVISGINTFSIKGKIFAHKVYYVTILIGEDGSRGAAGRVNSGFYFDEDGDGIFETLYLNQNSIDHLPDWIKK